MLVPPLVKADAQPFSGPDILHQLPGSGSA